MSFENDTTLTHPAPELDKRYFTLDQANNALPYISRIIDDVISIYARIVELRRRLERHDDADTSALRIERDYEGAMDRLGELVDELHFVGVELKDFERGLVDFPAFYNEREILLCWHRGEDEVSHWHEVDAGVGGRKPVAILSE